MYCHNVLLSVAFNAKDLVDIASLIVSGLTLFIAYLVYRKFLVQQAQQKQLDVVCSLINEIQYSFHLYHDKPAGTARWVTLLDLTEDKFFDQHDRLYFFGYDGADADAGIDESKEITNWNFFTKFYANPLLPKPIAERLKVFKNSNWTTKRYEQVKNDNCIIIGRKSSIMANSSCFYVPNTPLESCKDFKNALVELRAAIEKWLIKYGIKDINFTTSHHFKMQ